MGKTNDTAPVLTTKDIQRFWAKVNIGNDEECWPWTGQKNWGGYGRFRTPARHLIAHRVALFIKTGIWAVPCCLHKCDNRPCCNPGHLSQGTYNDNIQDMVRKNRNAKGDTHYYRTQPALIKRGDSHPARMHPEKMARGSQNGQAKLTEQKVIDMRTRYDNKINTTAQLAKEFDLSASTVQRIVRRHAWRHLP